MSSNMSATEINSTNSVAYLASDRTELAPLCSTHQDTRGLRIVISFISVFTLFVSIALATQLHHGDYQVTPHGTVVSDDADCSSAGITIMEKGGNAVDAAIATLFCLSVVLPHLVGIGGGGYMIVYNQRQREVVGCLDFWPMKGSIHSSTGVPGFVAGLYEAHKSYGKLSWPALLNPAIEMAGSGFRPSANALSAIPLTQNHSDLITLLTSGYNLPLMDTLKTLAANGSDEFYNGSLSSQMSGYVSWEDLGQYQVMKDSCITGTLGSYRLSVAGPGTGGPLLLELLTKIRRNESEMQEPAVGVALHLKETILVSTQYSSGVNVAVVDHNDIYVSSVSGLGSVLGSLDLTSGGYLMNNVVTSAKVGTDGRLTSLASPIVITQPGSACGHRVVTGATDVRDATQLLIQIFNTIKNNASLQSASESARARIFGSQVKIEKNHIPQLSLEQITELRSFNYTVAEAPQPYPSLNIIHKLGDNVIALADDRGGGKPASF